MGPCVNFINLLNQPSRKKQDQEWEDLKDIFRKNNFTLTETSVDPDNKSQLVWRNGSKDCGSFCATTTTISKIKINIDDSTHIGGTATLISTNGTTDGTADSENAHFLCVRRRKWRSPWVDTYHLDIVTGTRRVRVHNNCAETSCADFVGTTEQRPYRDGNSSNPEGISLYSTKLKVLRRAQ